MAGHNRMHSFVPAVVDFESRKPLCGGAVSPPHPAFGHLLPPRGEKDTVEVGAMWLRGFR